VGCPPAAALAASAPCAPVPAEAEYTDGLPALVPPPDGDDRGELGLVMPDEPEDPPPRLGADGAEPDGAGPAAGGSTIDDPGGVGGNPGDAGAGPFPPTTRVPPTGSDWGGAGETPGAAGAGTFPATTSPPPGSSD